MRKAARGCCVALVWFALLGGGCYERGIVPDPEGPVPKVKFDKVTNEFRDSMREGKPTFRRTEGAPKGFGPGMVPSTSGNQPQGAAGDEEPVEQQAHETRPTP